MCGRFTSLFSPEELKNTFDVQAPPDISPRYNIANVIPSHITFCYIVDIVRQFCLVTVFIIIVHIPVNPTKEIDVMATGVPL